MQKPKAVDSITAYCFRQLVLRGSRNHSKGLREPLLFGRSPFQELASHMTMRRINGVGEARHD